MREGLGRPDWASGRGSRLRCTLFGAEYSSKKIAVLAQNLENKGVKFFLPPRSMVLKVVRGKILETWELARFPLARGAVLERRAQGMHWSDSAGDGPGVAPVVRLSKNGDYLVDNIYVTTLSRVAG
jgi:hypothetical protein